MTQSLGSITYPGHYFWWAASAGFDRLCSSFGWNLKTIEVFSMMFPWMPEQLISFRIGVDVFSVRGFIGECQGYWKDEIELLGQEWVFLPHWRPLRKWSWCCWQRCPHSPIDWLAESCADLILEENAVSHFICCKNFDVSIIIVERDLNKAVFQWIVLSFFFF